MAKRGGGTPPYAKLRFAPSYARGASPNTAVKVINKSKITAKQIPHLRYVKCGILFYVFLVYSASDLEVGVGHANIKTISPVSAGGRALQF